MFNNQSFQVWTMIGKNPIEDNKRLDFLLQINLPLPHVLISDEFTILDIQFLQELSTSYTQIFQHSSLKKEDRLRAGNGQCPLYTSISR
jgi:hypothetical protein